LLAKGADINAKDQGETALTLCADQGNTEIVQALLDAGADVTVKTGWWNCALSAAAGGHSVIAAALLDKGADINVKDKDGETALHLPLSKGMPMWWKSHSTEG